MRNIEIKKNILTKVFGLTKRVILEMLYRFNSFRSRFSRLQKFYLPNLIYLLEHEQNFGVSCTFQQSTRFVGSGEIVLGDHCNFGFKKGGFIKGGGIEIQTRSQSGKIIFGNNVSTNNNIFISAVNEITIGNNTRIGQNVTIMDFEAHGTDPSKRSEMGEIGSVNIGDNVWIGNNVIILKNTIVGANSIIAAGAVISGKFPNNVIIGGVPGKIIKQIE